MVGARSFGARRAAPAWRGRFGRLVRSRRGRCGSSRSRLPPQRRLTVRRSAAPSTGFAWCSDAGQIEVRQRWRRPPDLARLRACLGGSGRKGGKHAALVIDQRSPYVRSTSTCRPPTEALHRTARPMARTIATFCVLVRAPPTTGLTHPRAHQLALSRRVGSWQRGLADTAGHAPRGSLPNPVLSGLRPGCRRLQGWSFRGRCKGYPRGSIRSLRRCLSPTWVGARRARRERACGTRGLRAPRSGAHLHSPPETPPYGHASPSRRSPRPSSFLDDWEEARYRHVIDMGKAMDPLGGCREGGPATKRSEGCASQVWDLARRSRVEGQGAVFRFPRRQRRDDRAVA